MNKETIDTAKSVAHCIYSKIGLDPDSVTSLNRPNVDDGVHTLASSRPCAFSVVENAEGDRFRYSVWESLIMFTIKRTALEVS